MYKREDITEHIQKSMRNYRLNHSFTQEYMAEILGMSTRAYWNHEHGKHGVSVPCTVSFLLLLSEEELTDFLEGLRSLKGGQLHE